MKISNNFLAVLVVIFILFSLSNTLNNLGIIVTGKASDSGTASLEVLPFTLSTPSNFQAFVNIDYESINLNWTVVSEADYYVIYYSSNLTEINALNISDISAGITNTSKIYSSNWTDSTANSVTERYYKIASFSSSLTNLSDKIVGKYTYTFYGTTNPSNAHRIENWFHIPFNISITIEEFMDDIGDSAEKTTKLLRPSNNSYHFITHVHTINDGKNFSVSKGEGYALFVNKTINHTIAGDVSFDQISYTLQGVNNPSNAHRVENWLGIPFNITGYSEAFMEDIGDSTEKMTKLIRTSDTAYQFYTHVHNINDGKNFSISKVAGYALFVNQTTNYTTN